MDADAVVIGAGAAGLAAARSLANKSLHVIVLEARDRVGGRVWSRNFDGLATPVEMGAEFIHGKAMQTMALLREAGVGVSPITGQSWMCGRSGGLEVDDEDFLLGARILERARSLQPDESVDRFLRRLEADQTTREAARAARAFVEGFEAADPADASARAIAEELHSGVDYTSSRPIGSYQQMFHYLRDACLTEGVKISLSTTVERVTWSPSKVFVETHDAGKKHLTIQARAAIITLPVGVLRHRGDDKEIRFEPSLPAATKNALENIEMGHAVKVGLWFRTAFWQRIDRRRYRDADFFHCEGHPFAAYWTQFPVHSELIVAWAGGPKAIALRGTPDSQVIECALNSFASLFADPSIVREEFAGAAMHDWAHDDCSRGVYSYVAVGGGDARAALAAPVKDTLFFAGEATATDGQGGTVSGALGTGERAALELASALRAKAG